MPSKTPKRPKIRKGPARRFVLIPRRTTPGEKKLLAEYVKAMPLTKKMADAKKFRGKQGAYKFLNRHRALRRRLRVVEASQIAA
jgi:hypothetical protein